MNKPEIWVDGKFVGWERATVHVLSHSLQRGSTVFESLSCEQTARGPAIFRLDAHVDRFLESARLTKMHVPFSRGELIEATKETVRRSGCTRCCIRPLAYYVGEELEVVPKQSAVQVIIAVAPPIDARDKFRVKVSSVKKLHPDTVPVAAKVAANYLSGMLAKREALDDGFDEAILLDCGGNVAEGPTESLFIVKHGAIKTVPLGTVLAGITRDSVMQIATDIGYRVTETNISVAELYDADEIFVAGTGAGVVPVVQLDDREIGRGQPGEIALRLRAAYSDAVTGNNAKYDGWLTYVKEAN
ncbi:MAG: branched-chain amino acid transaminase [Candidatus Hydrogenedentes bacterium]|nr:branched-chain amino acid transaminase [Candidatus Hydrogenedentota bacterium]